MRCDEGAPRSFSSIAFRDVLLPVFSHPRMRSLRVKFVKTDAATFTDANLGAILEA
ncbi:hypothetical protein BD309DRAFT_970194 [Dichomitus squalens]|nr:hypothetical protein BD309DRAFT_970194 [Dichomitus squalens]